MKKLLPVFCFLYLMRVNTFSQSIFTFDLKKDIIIGSVSLGVGISSLFVNNEPENVSDILNKIDVNDFDRSIIFSHNKTLDIISDYSVYAMLLIPVLSVIPNITDTNTFLTYGIMYAEALLFTFGTQYLLKSAIIRYRPYMYEDGIPDGKGNDYYNSFPSGATSLAFFGATFLSTTFSDEFPESKWKLSIITGSYTLAIGVASLRILSGCHFLTDVFMGAAIGSLYGWLIPWLHLRNDNEKISIVPTGNGLIVSLKF